MEVGTASGGVIVVIGCGACRNSVGAQALASLEACQLAAGIGGGPHQAQQRKNVGDRSLTVGGALAADNVVRHSGGVRLASSRVSVGASW